jgi:hypothetical protein
MGKSWASAEEQSFLDPEFEAFMSFKTDKKRYGHRTRFLKGLYARYFAEFPMPAVDESGRSLEERMVEREAVSLQLHASPVILTPDVANSTIFRVEGEQDASWGSPFGEVINTSGSPNQENASEARRATSSGD